ncbi:mechanosensitive ion channel family protein [Hymenobacter sp. BRD67]|uniref:mechanosensitive ion channel family protein n=1 Tax=Hymenobacter sp. BRD67 TaxID=2675877 RepID=UPI0015679140|nr:mechanosensitive ion channel domain-containing protein [Hymenobacter sp. BRD67]QKG53394.1 mechanosensitive ion channel [Hymenobacter sp. BRD67]
MPVAPAFSLAKVDVYLERLTSLTVLYLPRLVAAVVLLAVGWWVIGWLSRLVAVATERLDVSLSSFLTSMFSIALKVLLLISAAGMAGFETTSFVAILGAAGLAVGLALQGTLANFAGGVLILVFKPFTIGDVIESQGKSGTVQAIQIFNTILLTSQGDTVILPNGATSNGVIVNKAHPKQALVEVPLEMDSATNLDTLRQQALPLMQRTSQALADPTPQVSIIALKPGATMTVAFRVHTAPGQEEVVRNELIESLQQLFAAQKPAE